MPGIGHETVIQLLTEQPQLVAAILDNLGYPVPPGEAKTADSVLSGLELRADHIVLLGTGSDRLAVILEAQGAPPTQKKWWSWACYQVLAGHQHDCCPSLVLVIALRENVARSCRRRSPFSTGPGGSQLGVAVIGPDDLTDGPPPGFDVAHWALLAVACAALDLDTPNDRERTLDAIEHAEEHQIERYSRLILAMASQQAVEALEDMMATHYKETIFDRTRAEGEAIGAGRSLLAVLKARGIDLPDRARDAVLACEDTDQLNRWIALAATADTLSDVFGEQLPDRA